MTRDQFDTLPPLIHRKVFLDATGLNKNTFHLLVNEGTIRKLPIGSRKSHMYYKEDAARLCGYIKTAFTRE
jgi:hypothetical protein